MGRFLRERTLDSLMTWRIGELLIKKKLISWEQLEDVLAEQKSTRELTGQILIRKGYISESLFYKALAEQFDMRFVDLNRVKINPRAINAIPRSVAEKYKLIPIEIREDVLLIGICNPLNVWPEVELKQLTKIQDIRTVLCLASDIERAITENYESKAAAEIGRILNV